MAQGRRRDGAERCGAVSEEGGEGRGVPVRHQDAGPRRDEVHAGEQHRQPVRGVLCGGWGCVLLLLIGWC